MQKISMPIVEDENPGDSDSIFNIEKIKQLFSLYKIPLVLAAIGSVFFLTGVIYIFKTQSTSHEVIFSSESSASARLVKSKITVDVVGAILLPNVYKLEEGSRISDALAAAGGLSAEADREWVDKNINRAAKLVDGGKIYIPSVSETKSSQTSFGVPQGKQNLSNTSNLLGVTTGKININTSSQTELEGLPGIGPVTAVKIINGRSYQTVEELKTKKIVGNALFEKIKNLLSL